MSIQVPADQFLLQKAQYCTENKLIESVKRRTQEDMEKRVVEDFRVKARAHKIAREVFDSEYDPSLAEFLPRQIDRNLLVACCGWKVIDKLINASISVFLSKH